ncbi:MAG: UDP-N-acetylmuramoyl-L-alanyl-D-glutamate--2,6-diaminopimelate ligase [Spirochaetales bacterium]|nr:UDP-N-acetylmuramoyl-L-alanyl-D-glutamate--2,6-diaminopimelate ligase [Spirochaetales bacterium]
MNVPEKKLSKLIRHISTKPFNQKHDRVVNAIAYDSRKVKEGTIFVALTGLHTDGHRFVVDAEKQGAAAVIAEDKKAVKKLGIPAFVVADSREAMSKLSAALYDFPSEKLFVIGVTGTDGKSSTVWFIHQLLERMNKKSGFLSTAALQTADEVVDNPFRQSTPESPEVHRVLYEMANNGKEFAVIEATSHGLSPKTMRLADVVFDAGVYTNIAHEHLEFHGTFEQYREDKSRLFSSLKIHTSQPQDRPRFAVINKNSPAWEFFLNTATVPVYTYGTETIQADLSACNIRTTLTGSGFTVLWKDAQIPARLSVPGEFNIENALAAMLVVSCAANVPLPLLVDQLPLLSGVRGRMDRVDCSQPFHVFVDFAHTPQSFEKLLPMMREATPGRLIVVFGSAGERDVEKRPMLGKAAAAFCDIVILADEDPRGEDSMAILEEIAAGCGNLERGASLFLIPDRYSAIQKAFSSAKENDTVLLLGKGHEKSIIYSTGKIPWDERVAAEDVLKESGYGKTI